MKSTSDCIGFLLCSLLLAGCASPSGNGARTADEQALRVRWQRLVDDKGQTCDRCGGTERATEQGVNTLRRCLKPTGIQVVLDKTALTPAEFAKDPLESNRIWIADKPFEEWLQAKVGKSQCSGACGQSECRTLTVDGKTYDTIPAELIVRAGLLAAASLVGNRPENPWNPTATWSQDAPACCPTPAGAQRK
jgi:hypothetical protein